MKRLSVILFLILMAPACALAFDLSPYILPDAEWDESYSPPVPLSANDYLQEYFHPGEGFKTDFKFEHHLLRVTDRQRVMDISLPGHGGYALLYADGRFGLLQATSYPEETKEMWKEHYTVYDVEGEALANPRTFDGDPYALALYPFGFAGMRDEGNDQSELVLYDAKTLDPYFRYTIPFSRAYVQDACVSGGAVYALVKQHGRPSLPDCIILRISEDGLDWVYHTTDKDFRYNVTTPDGQGGILLKGSLNEDYKQSRITCIDAAGSERWSKTLSGKKAVIHPALTIPNPDGTAMLYGYCVAKSRGLFTVFAAALSAQGDILSLDVRDYSARADTGPNIMLAQDGTVLVYSFEIDSANQPGVLVPFDALPKAKDPGIRME